MAELRIARVTKRFGDFEAVKDFDAVIADQEFLVLLGPSGCGKSTLLRCIAGLEVVDDGLILIGGEDVTYAQPRHRGIAMVFQSYAVFPHLTVFENIAFGLRRQKKPNKEIIRRVQEAAALLHIEDLLDRHPANLSGGQRQRVAVARALATGSQLLLMDEPLSNLDALLRLEMRAELKTLLNNLEATTLYVTHDQVEALSMGDRIAVMNDGELLQVGAPLDIYDNPATHFIGSFIGNPPMNFLEAQVLEGGRGVRVHDFDLRLAPRDGRSGSVLLGVRAEAINTHTEEREGALPVKVIVMEPLGDHNLLTVRAGEDQLKVSTRPDTVFTAGENVWLEFLPERVRWFDPESGKAVT